MSCRIPREGSPCLSSFFLLIVVFLLLTGLLFAPKVSAFTATTLGDFQNIAVMEVSGDFNAIDGYGQPNIEPRRVIAREFYRTHGDDYDFLVIFTNFDFLLPSSQTKAFFSPAKNDVRGIGLDLYDNTNLYSPNGSFLTHLQGTIDMANISGHVLEPTDPEFDDTLRTLTHEMLHRWGAYVHFRDGDSESDALLGIDRSHWSFLLDTGGSSLYGNQWLNNDDGTFTSIEPELIRGGEVIGRIFNPLELYLMGMIGKDRVPPLLLVEAPGIDVNRLPEPGVTIPGMGKTVTIADIIAVEGERVPDTANTRKELRVAFIHAVAPGSWAATDAVALRNLAAISYLQWELEKRFSILTDGVGMLRAGVIATESMASNPGVFEPPVVPAAMPDVNKGVAWLLTQQQPGGFWQDQPDTALRDTAAAVVALQLFPNGAAGVAGGQAWLGIGVPDNSDFLARKQDSLNSSGLDEILDLQNADGGWGSAPGFCSNPSDTALMLKTLTNGGVCPLGGSLTGAVNYLHAVQNADGGWSPGFGVSMVQATAQALLALNPCRASYSLEPVIADGLTWLSAKQNADGGFGNSPSTVADTALALQAIKATGGDSAAVNRAAGYLLARQADSGGWNASSFQSALAVKALHAAQVAADLVIETGDITITPATVAIVPSSAAVTATVRNRGSTPVIQVKVSLYHGDPALGRLIGEAFVDVPGNGSTPVNFAVTVSEFGLNQYTVVVDGDQRVAEANEWNNAATKSLAVNLPPPTVGFDLSSSSGPESRTTVALAVSLSYPWPEPITVNYAVSAGSTAVAAKDYLLAGGSLTFAVDQTSKTINFSVVNDLVAEVDKIVIVDLATPSPGTLGLSRHTYTIRDDEAPTVVIASPPGGVIGLASPQLLYTTTGSSVLVKVDGVVVDKSSGGLLGPLADGPHSVEVTAGNSYGLVTTARVDFAVDTALPTIVIKAPAAGTVTNAQPRLDYTATSAVKVEVLLDGVVVNKVADDCLGPLADGAHTLKINVWNASGSRSSAQAAFRVDARPPVVTINYPGNEFIREVNPRLLCQVDEPGEAVVWLDGVESSLAIGELLGPLESGTHQLRVAVTDAAGNTGSAEVSFAVAEGAEAAYALATGWPRTVAGRFGGSDVDKAGNVYVVTRKAEWEFNFAKFDTAGNLVWQTTSSSLYNIMGSAWVDVAPKDLAVDSAGNLYVVGWGQTGTSNYGVLAKFDANGRPVGHVILDTGVLYGDVYVVAVAVDAHDQVYIAGNTEYGLFAGELNATRSMFVAKYNSSLSRLQGRSHGGPGSFYFVNLGALAVDSRQNLYVTGKSADNRLRVWKLNPDLSRSEVEIIGIDNSHGCSVAVDLFGNIYVAGQEQNGGALWKFPADGGFADRRSVLIPREASSLVANNDGSVFLLDFNGTVRKFDQELSPLWELGLGGGYSTKLADAGDGQLVVSGAYASATAQIARLADPRDAAFQFDAAVSLANNTTVEISGTLEPGFDLVFETPGLTLTDYRHDPVDGAWQMSLAGLSEGENRITVSVTNSFGIPRRHHASVVVDTLPPGVSIASPADGSSWLTRPALTYTVTEGETRVFVNGIDATRLSGYPLDCLAPGENRIRVESIDPAGNVGFADITVFAANAAVGENPLILGEIRKLGTVEEQTVVDTGQDAAGNIYVFGDTSGPFPGFSSSGQDVYVAKFAPSGELVGFWQFGSPNNDFGAGLAVTPNGEFLVAYNVGAFTPNDDSMMVQKYAADGTLLWSDTLDSGAYDQIRDIEVDGSGNVFVCGLTRGRLNNKRFGGINDYFLIKYGAAGRTDWTILSNAPTDDFLNDIELAADGTIFGTGRMNDTGRMSLFKFTATGVLLWAQEYAYTGQSLSGRRLAIGGDGSLFTLVESNSSAYYFVTKHDQLGNFCKYAVGHSHIIRGLGLVLDNRSDVYVTGLVDDPYNLGWSLEGNRGLGGEDIFVAKYASADLQTLWTRQLGDADDQHGVEILFGRANGQIYLAGVTAGSLGGASLGGQDIFVAELIRPVPPAGPVLTITDYRSPTKEQSVLISGTVTSGAIVEATLDGPAASLAVISRVAQYSDGTWHFTAGNLTPNIDNVLIVRAMAAFGEDSQRLAIAVDTLPPLLDINPVVSPLEEQTSQLISGRVEAGAMLTVSVNQASAKVVAVADGSWSHMVSNLQFTENLVNFTATDAAGNTTVRSVTITCIPPLPLNLAVSPKTVAETECADISLTIEHVYPLGASVTVEQVLDLDRDGVADGSDPVVRRFSVSDGFRADNPNIPGDFDGVADGKITVVLNGQFIKDRYHAVGQYVFSARTAIDRASDVLSVMDTVQPQKLHGTVRDSQGAPVGGSLVTLLDAWGRSFGFAMTDMAGQYRFNVKAPGEYLPVPMAQEYVYERMPSSPVTVASGQIAMQDLTLATGDRRVIGRILDAETSVGLAGVQVRAENERYLAVAMTLADGNFNLGLPDGDYRLTVEIRPGDGLAAHGYLGAAQSQQTINVSSDLSGLELPVSPGDALVCGVVTTAAGIGVGGAPVQALAADSSGTAGETVCDGQGNFCVALSAGRSWQLALNDAVAQGAGTIGTLGTTESANLTVYPIDSRVAGTVQDEDGQPIAGVEVVASHGSGAGAAVVTDSNGRYLLGISSEPAGDWTLVAYGEDFNYEPVEPVNVTAVLGQTATQNFTLIQPRLANTIVVTKAVYEPRKKVLSVEATSNYDNAQLQVVGYGPMKFSKLLKGKYYWSFSGVVASKPATVSVSGPEGTVTMAIP